ncbi:unnamed protein product, partial [Ixodes pacificus]
CVVTELTLRPFRAPPGGGLLRQRAPTARWLFGELRAAGCATPEGELFAHQAPGFRRGAREEQVSSDACRATLETMVICGGGHVTDDDDRRLLRSTEQLNQQKQGRVLTKLHGREGLQNPRKQIR